MRCLSVLNALLVCFVVYRVVFVVGARERNGRRERRPGTAVASCSRIDRRRKDVESGDWLGTRQTRQFYRLVCCPLVNLFYKYFPSSSSKPTQYRLSTDNQRVFLALCIAVFFPDMLYLNQQCSSYLNLHKIQLIYFLNYDVSLQLHEIKSLLQE